MIELAAFILVFVTVPLYCHMEHLDLDARLMIAYFDEWAEDAEDMTWSVDADGLRAAQIRCAGWNLFFESRLGHVK